MIRYQTIAKFSEGSGYSEDAIRTKIRDAVWVEGEVWRKAPDGRILIIVEGYESWVEMGAASNPHRKQPLKSVSCLTELGVAKGSTSRLRPLT